MILRPGDIFVTAGDSIVSFGIRLSSRTKGEDGAQVNHVGIVVSHGTQDTAEVVEALAKVKHHKLADQYGGRTTAVRVWRPRFVTHHVANLLAANAVRREGQHYGYGKIAAHAVDRWLFGGRYAVRRLFVLEQMPICSMLVAAVYEQVLGYRFGVEVREAQPDDIDDWCKDHPDEWEELTPLLPIDQWGAWARPSNEASEANAAGESADNTQPNL